MKFSEVLPALEAGRRCRHEAWNGYVVREGDKLFRRWREAGGEMSAEWSMWQLLQSGRVISERWEVIPEEPAKGEWTWQHACCNHYCAHPSKAHELHETIARLTRELEEAREAVREARDTLIQRITVTLSSGIEVYASLVGAGRRSEAGAPNGGTDR